MLGCIGLAVGAINVRQLVHLFLLSGWEIKANTTSSLPERWWLIYNKKTTDFKVGDYFVFYAPKDYMLTKGATTPVVKEVKGVAGDLVSVKGRGIYINNKSVGLLWPQTGAKNGKVHKLTPIQSQTIPDGCYFAWTPALYSYDSRYTDIGLICEKDHRIIGSARPLF